MKVREQTCYVLSTEYRNTGSTSLFYSFLIRFRIVFDSSFDSFLIRFCIIFAPFLTRFRINIASFLRPARCLTCKSNKRANTLYIKALYRMSATWNARSHSRMRTRARAEEERRKKRNIEIEERKKERRRRRKNFFFLQMLTHLCHLPVVRRRCRTSTHQKELNNFIGYPSS